MFVLFSKSDNPIHESAARRNRFSRKSIINAKKGIAVNIYSRQFFIPRTVRKFYSSHLSRRLTELSF